MLLGTAGLCGCADAGKENAEAAAAVDAGRDQSIAAEEEPVSMKIPDDLTGGKPWMDSSIPGNVTPSTITSPVDDLYLYSNKDWIISHELPEGSPVTQKDLVAGFKAKVRETLNGEALSEHDARQAQLLFKAFADTDKRQAAGTDPAKQVIEHIRSLSSVADLSAFLLDLDQSAGVPTFISVRNGRDYDAHRWVTEIGLSDETFGRRCQQWEWMP